ncbi:dihydrolipoyl dehydrogenase [Parachitinimonas caeni]|uniref:Dihydrolipoyl dehydrogenase n=1 Tax=Parachitinimonas caeni TaxID=3031301 RepID=A0ABT7DS89_9NEIS|nr:dihydrolipoyl dehydrogenase [Parachitinimonas caeni]MDK2122932.1 dihydrolipoyl dehydrogenase [Parachitinimonas caeni]
MREFDVVVIGAGPGGYVAAICAAQLGMRTALVEAADLGGVCLNWGCIPTKTLLHSADVLRQMRAAERIGLGCDNPRFDLDKIVARSRAVAGQLTQGVGYLLKKNGVTVVHGWGRLAGPNKVQVESDHAAELLTTRNVVLATGAKPRPLPFLPFDGERVWSYRDALMPKTLPSRLLVIGAGAIGVEFASFYATLGCKVELVEQAAQVLPAEDAEIAAIAAKGLGADGITLRTGCRVEAASLTDGGVKVRLADAQGTHDLEYSHVLVAIGVVADCSRLGLETVGLDSARLSVEPDCSTAAPGVWAIGDLAGAPQLAHKASHEARSCAEAIAGLEPHPLNPLRIPACTYSHPQVARVGMTEAQAIAAGRQIRVGRFPFRGNGKALATDAGDGLCKTVFDARTGELLGAHLVGEGATELIHSMVVAMNLETTESELMSTIFPHPTLSEMLHESVLSAFDRALHI